MCLGTIGSLPAPCRALGLVVYSLVTFGVYIVYFDVDINDVIRMTYSGKRFMHIDS